MEDFKNIRKESLNNIINETVNDVIKRIGILNEMSIPLKSYKTRVDGLRFQLVENWCLCKWCQLFKIDSENFYHWLCELKCVINNLKLINIKNNIDKKKTLVKMLIKDYDYNDASMIERIIRDKFNHEKITDKNQKLYVCSEFSKNIQNLIEVISNNNISTSSYLEKVFNHE